MLIHDALAEYLLCPLTEIRQSDVKLYTDKLSETPPDIMPSLLQNIFLVSALLTLYMLGTLTHSMQNYHINTLNIQFSSDQLTWNRNHFNILINIKNLLQFSQIR